MYQAFLPGGLRFAEPTLEKAVYELEPRRIHCPLADGAYANHIQFSNTLHLLQLL